MKLRQLCVRISMVNERAYHSFGTIKKLFVESLLFLPTSVRIH